MERWKEYVWAMGEVMHARTEPEEFRARSANSLIWVESRVSEVGSWEIRL